MARLIELTEEELNQLLTDKEIPVHHLASRTIQILNNVNGQELLMNYEGDGYRPVQVIIKFEYDESINF